jgi:hypothetical protein
MGVGRKERRERGGREKENEKIHQYSPSHTLIQKNHLGI